MDEPVATTDRNPRLAWPGLGPSIGDAPRPLAALEPRPTHPPLAGTELRAYLEDGFALAEAWCRWALARGAEDDISRQGARRDWRDACRQFNRWRGSRTPLGALGREFRLSRRARTLLFLAAAPFLWGELADLYHAVADDEHRPLVDEFLLCDLLGVGIANRGRIARELDGDAPLVRKGLLGMDPVERPFAAISVAPEVIRRLAGAADATPARSTDILALDELQLPRDRLLNLLEQLACAGNTPARVVVRGRPGSGRRTLAESLAALAGRSIGLVEIVPGQGAEDRLRSALRSVHLGGGIPCVSGALDESDVVQAARLTAVLDGHPGPLFFRAACGMTPRLAGEPIVFDYPTLRHAAQIQVWTRALERNRLPSDAAPELARAYPVGAGTATRVAARASLTGGADTVEIAVQRLDQTLRDDRARRLGRLATRIERLPTWDDLVLPEDDLDSLRQLAARIELRYTVLETWGMERVSSSCRGVSALFQGGPGTGKTLAAGALAHRLGFELYRVDLSQVVSKWMGETEKNLGAVFDAAEDGRCVLLLDEADSLLAKRNEVKSSNDRSANMETNYILQRLDTFDGIAVLTTNFGTALDPAVVRRLSMHLQFPFPDAEQRELLWRRHLPATLPIDGDLDVRHVARRPLSGGYIRNAALRAAYLAAMEGGKLTSAHLERAVDLAYRDRGAISHGTRLE